jgi:hypothetical protein
MNKHNDEYQQKTVEIQSICFLQCQDIIKIIGSREPWKMVANTQ